MKSPLTSIKHLWNHERHNHILVRILPSIPRILKSISTQHLQSYVFTFIKKNLRASLESYMSSSAINSSFWESSEASHSIISSIQWIIFSLFGSDPTLDASQRTSVWESNQSIPKSCEASRESRRESLNKSFLFSAESVRYDGRSRRRLRRDCFEKKKRKRKKTR